MSSRSRSVAWKTWRFLRVLVIVGLGAVIVPITAAGTVVASLIFLPLPATLPPAKIAISSQPSVVLDSQGNQIFTFREFEQQLPVQQSDIPAVLKHAVIASEDRNFYHHGGVDPRGSLRALVADLRGKGYVQGGSTIAQQYVKNTYTDKKRTLSRKLKEAILAGQLARSMPKDEILFKYLDSIYFGDGAYGVGAASETYFHKPVNQLNIGEAALLAGLIPAPSRYEPRANELLAEQRRQTVLKKMLDQGYINQNEFNYWKVAQVFPGDKVGVLVKGAPATLVYPAQQDAVTYPYFKDYVRRWLELDPRVGPTLLYRGGLRIQTTIDPLLQLAAQAAVNKTLAGTAPPLEMALVSVEPQTGFVKAFIGGRDFNVDQANLALGGCEPTNGVQVLVAATCADGNTPKGGGTGRQPGSSFKAFTLATAFERGVQPTETFNAPRCYTPPGQGSANTICNAEPSGFGRISLRNATWYSVNTVYAQLILDPRVGVQRVAEMAKRLGITSAWYAPSIHGASYTLGAVGVSPLDMASAYGVFDNHGVRVAPTPVALVEDPTNKKLLIDNRQLHGTQVIDPAIADNVTDVLRGVISQPGATGTAGNINRPAAGKTGTTTDYRDAWFVGYVPTLSTAVWMGNKDKETDTLRNVHGVPQPPYGGSAAAPTWAAFMSQAVKNVPVTDFSQPAPLQPIANQLDRTQRKGLDPGPPSYPSDVGSGGPYEFGPTPPPATAPTTSTSTTVANNPRGSPTSTTAPGGGLGLRAPPTG